MYRIIIHPVAEKEFSESVIWYEEQKDGLGNRFVQSIEAGINKIRESPEVFGYSLKPFREAPVRFFPFTIVFKINKRKRVIYILAIYHTSRNPKEKFKR